MSDKPFWLTGNHCATCKWMRLRRPLMSVENEGHEESLGFCHRYPPVYCGSMEPTGRLSDMVFSQVVVFAADYCGEYTPKDKEETQ